MFRQQLPELKLKPSFLGVVIKHFDGIQGIIVQVFAHQEQLLQYIVGDRDDVTAHGVSLEDVQKFPGLAQISSWLG